MSTRIYEKEIETRPFITFAVNAPTFSRLGVVIPEALNDLRITLLIKLYY